MPGLNARCAALVLAGGAGRRLGGVDKTLLPVAGQPILARILATLGADIPDIAISANGDPARFAAFARPVLADGDFAGQGPLAGLLAGLDWASAIGAETLLSVPGDTPFIPPGLAVTLAPAPAVAASAGHVHHLVALWPVAVRAALRAHLLLPGTRRVQDFAGMIGLRRVDFPALPWDRFMNINTAEDLETARRIAGTAA